MTKYKYNINYQISLLPRSVSINDIVAILEKEGITKDTFYRDRNLQPKAKTSIPTDRLLKYAKLFECTLEELLTTEAKGKSIRQRLMKTDKTIKNRLS